MPRATRRAPLSHSGRGWVPALDDNHYSLLASLENIFGLPRLGDAGQLGLPVLDAGEFNAYAGS